MSHCAHCNRVTRVFKWARLRIIRHKGRKASHPQQPTIGHHLPPDVLHLVFEHLEFDECHNEVLSACIRVCKLWYPLVRPHLFAWISVRRDQEPFSAFCRANPGIARWIKRIDFYGAHWACAPYRRFNTSREAFDVERLVSIRPLLPSLRVIQLFSFDSRTLAPGASGSRSQSTPLSSLSLDACYGMALILPVLCSLFAVDTLKLVNGTAMDAHREALIQSHPSTRQQSFAITNLVVTRVSAIWSLLRFLENVLAPQCLRAFATGYSTDHDLSTLTHFLRSEVSNNLISISIDLNQSGRLSYDGCSVTEGARLLPATAHDPLLKFSLVKTK